MCKTNIRRVSPFCSNLSQKYSTTMYLGSLGTSKSFIFQLRPGLVLHKMVFMSRINSLGYYLLSFFCYRLLTTKEKIFYHKTNVGKPSDHWKKVRNVSTTAISRLTWFSISWCFCHVHLPLLSIYYCKISYGKHFIKW